MGRTDVDRDSGSRDDSHRNSRHRPLHQNVLPRCAEVARHEVQKLDTIKVSVKLISRSGVQRMEYRVLMTMERSRYL